MTSINWELCPEATHFIPKRDDSGMFCDVFWKVVDGVPVTAWQVQPAKLVEFKRPSYTGDETGRMIARDSQDQGATLREKAIHDLTGLMLENQDMNQYYLARLIVDAGYSKKESP